jgi:inorganic pyrophosphatase
MLAEVPHYRRDQRRTKRWQKIRNDRIVAVEKQNHSWANIETLDDLGKKFLDELEEFFVNYHELSGEKYTLL